MEVKQRNVEMDLTVEVLETFPTLHPSRSRRPSVLIHYLLLQPVTPVCVVQALDLTILRLVLVTKVAATRTSGDVDDTEAEISSGEV